MASARAFAVDLGADRTRVVERDVGLVLDEPTVVAVTVGRREIVAMGERARQAVVDGEGELVIDEPARTGVISDFPSTARLLQLVLDQLQAGGRRTRMLLGAPVTATNVERRALTEAARRAGAGSVELIEEPLAAAIGLQLPVAEPVGSLVLDLGAGTTQVGVISLGGVVVAGRSGVGGHALDQALIDRLRERHDVIVGDRVARRLKEQIGSAVPGHRNGPEAARITGRDRDTGLARDVLVPAGEVADALSGPVDAIVELVRRLLADCPAELLHDVLGTGVHLVGGGSALPGLGERLQRNLGLEVNRHDDPLQALVRGAGLALDAPGDLARLLAH